LGISRLTAERLVSLVIILAVSTYATGQTVNKSATHKDGSIHSRTADSIAEQKDLADIFNSIVKWHTASGPDSTLEKPGKLLLSLAPAAAYTLEGGPTATIVVNASFYASDPKTTNLSVFTFGGQYSLRHQLIIPFISNIWSKDNKFDWLGDWRYYNYPTYTYGLGSDNSISTKDATDYSYIKVYQEVLRHFSSNYYAGIGYYFDDHYNITDDGNSTDFETYNQGLTKTVSSGPIIHVMYDSRTNSNNPKDALYASVIFRSNFIFLGSDQDWQSLLVEVRKYFRLSSNSVLAFWSWNEFTNGIVPYFDLPANQWDTYSNTARGYIQGFYRGTNLVYLEAEYRFGITRNGLFGGVLFSNAGSATQWPSNKFAYVDPGNGIGLRIKFNKYSDVNLCIDYAVGINGSHGFFFNLGEIF